MTKEIAAQIAAANEKMQMLIEINSTGHDMSRSIIKMERLINKLRAQR